MLVRYMCDSCRALSLSLSSLSSPHVPSLSLSSLSISLASLLHFSPSLYPLSLFFLPTYPQLLLTVLLQLHAGPIIKFYKSAQEHVGPPQGIRPTSQN